MIPLRLDFKVRKGKSYGEWTTAEEWNGDGKFDMCAAGLVNLINSFLSHQRPSTLWSRYCIEMGLVNK